MKEGKLIREAIKAKEMSYSPYSNFKVGAALLAKSGKIYTGTNIENASYGLACCAERVAIFEAVKNGERDFEAIAVVVDSGSPKPSCGACRQVLSEFSNDMKIILARSEKDYSVHTLKELLPLPFHLKK
jgi:cytidine deaminase